MTRTVRRRLAALEQRLDALDRARRALAAFTTPTKIETE